MIIAGECRGWGGREVWGGGRVKCVQASGLGGRPEVNPSDPRRGVQGGRPGGCKGGKGGARGGKGDGQGEGEGCSAQCCRHQHGWAHSPLGISTGNPKPKKHRESCITLKPVGVIYTRMHAPCAIAACMHNVSLLRECMHQGSLLRECMRHVSLLRECMQGTSTACAPSANPTSSIGWVPGWCGPWAAPPPAPPLKMTIFESVNMHIVVPEHARLNKPSIRNCATHPLKSHAWQACKVARMAMQAC